MHIAIGQANIFLCLTLVLLNPDIASLENSVDPDQPASSEAG